MTFPTVRLVDSLLGACGRLLTEARVRRLDRNAIGLGGYVMYVLLAVMALLFAVVSVRANSLSVFLVAIAILPTGIVLQYIALKMLGTVDRLIAASRTELTSSGFLDVVALINVLAAILAPLAGLFAASGVSQITPFLVGLFVMTLTGYTAAIALNPAVVNVHVTRSASIGQEAVGLITFTMKGFYRFTPIGFAALMVLTTISAVILLAQALFGMQTVSAAQEQAIAILLVAVYAVLLPFVSYVLFVLFYLVIDLYRSIFLIAQVASVYRRQDRPPGPTPADAPPLGSAAPNQTFQRPIR